MSETLLLIGVFLLTLVIWYWGYWCGRRRERSDITLDTYESWQKHNDRRKERPFS